MDFDVVLERAIALGCQLTDDGRGDHMKLFTPSGKLIPISRTAKKTKGVSDRAFQLMKRLREGGVDVKRGRAGGPVRRVSDDKLLCKERRCANLACPRNAIALEELPASGKAFASFRSRACGFIQVVGCGLVIRRGVDPELCALPSKHDGLCQPAPPKEEPVNHLSLAAPETPAESAAEGEKKRKKKVFASAEQKAQAVARARAGENWQTIADDYGVSRSAVGLWVRSAPPAAAAPAPAPPAVVNGAPVVTAPLALPAPAPQPPAQTLFAVDPPMLAVVQVGEETYDLAIPASELVKLVLKYRVSQ